MDLTSTFQKKYKTHKQAAPLYVIRATKPEPPAGLEALECVIETTLLVTSEEEARRLVGWYARRWQIEVIHRIWKSGCAVEERHPNANKWWQ